MASAIATDRVNLFWAAEAYRMAAELSTLMNVPMGQVIARTGMSESTFYRSNQGFVRVNRKTLYMAVRGVWWDAFHAGLVGVRPWAAPEGPPRE